MLQGSTAPVRVGRLSRKYSDDMSLVQSKEQCQESAPHLLLDFEQQRRRRRGELPQLDVPWRKQGDPSHNSRAALAAREQASAHAAVTQWIDTFWNTFETVRDSAHANSALRLSLAVSA